MRYTIYYNLTLFSPSILNLQVHALQPDGWAPQRLFWAFAAHHQSVILQYNNLKRWLKRRFGADVLWITFEIEIIVKLWCGWCNHFNDFGSFSLLWFSWSINFHSCQHLLSIPILKWYEATFSYYIKLPKACFVRLFNCY